MPGERCDNCKELLGSEIYKTNGFKLCENCYLYTGKRCKNCHAFTYTIVNGLCPRCKNKDPKSLYTCTTRLYDSEGGVHEYYGDVKVYIYINDISCLPFPVISLDNDKTPFRINSKGNSYLIEKVTPFYAKREQ